MDLGSIMQQAKVMQEKMAEIQQDLARKAVSGNAGGGMVEVTVNGLGEVLAVVVEPVAIDPREATILQDLIIAATNDALRKARELSKKEFGRLTGGINLPGLSDFLRP